MFLINTKGIKSRTVKSGLLLSSLFLLLFMQGCSDMNELVMNKSEVMMDGHRVVIRPCRESSLRTLKDTPTNRHHVFSCGDQIKVEINNDHLTVNEKSYGTLGRGDSVEVNKGKVFINKKEAVVAAMK